MPSQILSSQTFFGFGLETTRGTPVAATAFLPIESPNWATMPTWLEDKGLRGSPTEVYTEQMGVRHDEWDCKGDVFPDTFPHLLRMMLGSTDTIVAAGAPTTLSAAPAAGATTISTVATIAVGSVIVIDVVGSALAETHVTTAVSGAGPFTVTLSTQLALAHASGVAVTPLTSHAIGLVNNAALGSQPPSYTLVDMDGSLGTTVARQFANAMLSDLSLTFASTAKMGYTAKWLTNPQTTVTAPSNSYTGEIFIPSWACAVALGGAPSTTVVDGSIDLKRSTEAIHTLGTQAPHAIFSPPLSVSGKLVFVFESGNTIVASALQRQIQVLDLLFTEPSSGHLIDLRMSQVQLKTPKVNRGKAFEEIECTFTAEANTTDAVNGGYSPMKTFSGNAQVGAY